MVGDPTRPTPFSVADRTRLKQFNGAKLAGADRGARGVSSLPALTTKDLRRLDLQHSDGHLTSRNVLASFWLVSSCTSIAVSRREISGDLVRADFRGARE